jgi:undecaprenyl-diphosphatase
MNSLKRLTVWLNEKDHHLLDFVSNYLYREKYKPIMAFFSHPPKWILTAVLVFVLGFLVIGPGWVRWRVSVLICSVICSDWTCNLFKIWVKRIRPKILDKREHQTRTEKISFWSNYYSFPSSHAANFLCTTVFIWHWWPYAGLFLAVWSAPVIFSRVYLRSHYPSDVLTGCLIGGFYAQVFLNLFHKIL